MRIKGLVVVLSIFILYACLVSSSLSEENKGAGNMILKGGNRGDVGLPHARHQAALKDCKLCHHLFPQKKGSISDLISEGKLKKRAVMMECQGCHRKMAKTGLKTGPINCSSCHDHSLKK